MSEINTLIIIGVMSAVVLVTRLGGPEIMRLIGIDARMEKALATMAGAVVIAILANEVASGGLREATAIAVTAAALLIFRNVLVAMLLAVSVAAITTITAL
ncbi:MAG: AzlD domain-containing protein [Pseudomonadota bacterium]